MSEIDWDKAPEGATHHMAESSTDYECWLKKQGDKWFYMRMNGHAWMKATIDDDSLRTITGRPSPAWSGEGLPPVGVVCEYLDSKGEWYPAAMSHIGSHLFIVKYQHTELGQQESCMHIASNDGPISSRLRPIRTPEQIAADEREAAVNGMLCYDALGGSRRGLAEALYDAGYRKQDAK